MTGLDCAGIRIGGQIISFIHGFIFPSLQYTILIPSQNSDLYSLYDMFAGCEGSGLELSEGPGVCMSRFTRSILFRTYAEQKTLKSQINRSLGVMVPTPEPAEFLFLKTGSIVSWLLFFGMENNS